MDIRSLVIAVYPHQGCWPAAKLLVETPCPVILEEYPSNSVRNVWPPSGSACVGRQATLAGLKQGRR